jgi:hypothetical protein
MMRMPINGEHRINHKKLKSPFDQFLWGLAQHAARLESPLLEHHRFILGRARDDLLLLGGL